MKYKLTPAELNVLQESVNHYFNKQAVAAKLVIEPSTYKTHVRNITGKMQVRSFAAAALLAVREGWIQMPAEDYF